MSKGVRQRPRIGKRIKDGINSDSELYSMLRRLETPNAISTPSFSGVSGGSNSGVTGSSFLPTSGGTMIGAIAFFPKLITISSGAIDIGETTDNFSSRVIVSPESGSTDDLVTISNAKHSGQLLILQGVQTNTITLKTTGNIETIDGNDFALADDDNIIMIFDSTDNKWQQVTTGKVGVGDNLGNHTATQDLAMGNNDITGLANIDLDGTSATIQGVVNLDFYQTAQSINSLAAGLTYQAATGDTHEFIIGGASKFEIGTSTHSKIDIELTGGKIMKSSTSVEIGYQVGNESLTLGTEGSVILPYISNAVNAPSDVTVDSWFGNVNGAIGIQHYTTTPNYRIWIRANGSWFKAFAT